MELEQIFAMYPAIGMKAAEMGKFKQGKLNKKAWANAAESWDRMFPEDLAKLNAEIQSASVINKSLIATPTAVLCKEFGSLYCFPVRDIIWVYPFVFTQKMNFIPYSKTHYVRILERNGNECSITVGQCGGFSKKPISNDAMASIQQVISLYRPGIIFGYSQEIENFVRGNLAGAAAYVDEKSQVQGQ